MSRPRAWCMIREAPWYRREAFTSGLKAAGFEVIGRAPDRPAGRHEVLVIWNRYGGVHETASRFEREGGTVIVAENGYLSAGGSAPKFDVHPQGPKPGDYYALSLHGHNGSGRWPEGGPERWQALGIELRPWQRNEGGHILVAGQRGIGSPLMASPVDWHEHARARIQKATKRPVKVRLHPGNNAPKVPLSDDLRGAWACVVWSSGSGVKALTLGIPVFYDAPHWICSPGAVHMKNANYDAPLCDDAARLRALERMAWAQWTVAEIQSGEPFRRLMELVA